VRGVTYGTFRPDVWGDCFPAREVVEEDFRHMAASGANALRTYTVPPRWLLDEAERHGLYVMIGIPWEQHIAFLDEPGIADQIEQRVRNAVRTCAGHPAVLCYAVGNEIPAQIVRWSGRRRIERHVRRLYVAAKSEDPDALVTYVNYPSTEYLQLPFLDLVCFNVYLESPDRLASYLARLHHIAGDRPLLMGELGLDSIRHGELGQATGLEEQVHTVFSCGSAGAFVFSWTDEWHRGGHEIEDWAFGLTTRDRQPKRALSAVSGVFTQPPLPRDSPWPRVSVVVCAHNAGQTISDCLEGVTGLDYPDFEVMVVDDGSTDRTATLVRTFDVRLIRTPNRGLSHARNRGIEEATGEIVAFVDADARPDPHWLTYLAATFTSSTHAGVGGPNISPPGDGLVAGCVAAAPGRPTHVLLSDGEAEHIPGCNMAFRRQALEAIGGFDPRFRVAGDDVDVCWRLQQQGMTLGFSPAAFVWHHHRDSIGAFWRQQRGYGRAEALLEEKWPEKYNSAGHITWGGRVYGGALARLLSGRGRIYHGIWGGAPFQPYHPPSPSLLLSLTSAPEWYLVVLALALLSFLGLFWSPLLVAFPLLVLAAGAPVAQAVAGSWELGPARQAVSPRDRLQSRCLTALLHLLQPAARLRGRLMYGLTPWRLRSRRRFIRPDVQTVFLWSERARRPNERLELLEQCLLEARAVVIRGGPFDRWDLLVRGGLLGRVRLRACTEEHEEERQLIRVKAWPTLSPLAVGCLAILSILTVWAALDGAWLAATVLGVAAVATTGRSLAESGGAMAAVLEAIGALEAVEERSIGAGETADQPAVA
jgi:GT2 family glycosyltransferase